MLLKQPIKHQHFEDALNLAHVYALNAPPSTLTFLVGPSGAGKSTLRHHLYHSLYGERERWAKGQTPIVSVTANNAERGFYSSKDLFSKLLVSLGDPFYGNRQAIASRVGSDGDDELSQFLREPFWQGIRVGMTEMNMRSAFERNAPARGLQAILIDEAQMMCLTHVNRSPSDYLESLKCLAEETGTLIFFFGTYSLLEVWNHSSQLNRRSRLIHVSRYRADLAPDRKEFSRVLKQLSGALSPASCAAVRKNATMLIEASQGVFGELEAHIERARDLAQAKKADCITTEHIIETRMTEVQAQRLADEISEGESRVEGCRDFHPQTANTVRKVSAKRGRRPGRRNPVRDPCGGTP